MGDVSRNEERSRYEYRREGDVLSHADYRVEGDRVLMHHTYTDPAHRGQGLAEVVVRQALDDFRREGLAVVPQCWFVAEFIELNPEYGDLVTR
jgi:predicted GNAT family acetyltransferase